MGQSCKDGFLEEEQDEGSVSAPFERKATK